MTDLDPNSSPASNMQAIAAKGPTCLIHVGRPDWELPHKSMKRVYRLRQEQPSTKLFILVWTPEDRDAMKAHEDEKVKVLYWEDDAALSNFLMDCLFDLVGAFIISSRYYECADKHITEADHSKLVEKCGTCGAKVTGVVQNQEKLAEFAEVFTKVIGLSNFDTRSGDFLQSVVSPTANILHNAPYIVGCEHQPALEVRDREKGKTAIVVGAGPSLEDAIPHLKRLGQMEDHFIICVGRVYKLLSEGGVRVGYAASCEMFDWDAAIFDGLTKSGVGSTVLAFASMCAPATVRKWPGPKVGMLDIETAKLLGRTDFIYGGNSVAHHALNFALQILGAKEAILVGIDLSYTKPRTHAIGANHEGWPDNVKIAEDTYQEEKWLPCTGKGDKFDPDCHRMPVAIGGGGMAISNSVIVRSSPSYEHFGTLFEILIAKHGKKVYNGCPNGLKIKGTEYLDLGTYNP